MICSAIVGTPGKEISFYMDYIDNSLSEVVPIVLTKVATPILEITEYQEATIDQNQIQQIYSQGSNLVLNFNGADFLYQNGQTPANLTEILKKATGQDIFSVTSVNTYTKRIEFINEASNIQQPMITLKQNMSQDVTPFGDVKYCLGLGDISVYTNIYPAFRNGYLYYKGTPPDSGTFDLTLILRNPTYKEIAIEDIPYDVTNSDLNGRINPLLVNEGVSISFGGGPLHTRGLTVVSRSYGIDGLKIDGDPTALGGYPIVVGLDTVNNVFRPIGSLWSFI